MGLKLGLDEGCVTLESCTTTANRWVQGIGGALGRAEGIAKRTWSSNVLINLPGMEFSASFKFDMLVLFSINRDIF